MSWYLKVVRDNYSNFNGRARRKEYWMFILFNMIFAIGASIGDNLLGLNFTTSSGYTYGWIHLLYTLVVMIPGLAVLIRRLHDRGKSGGVIFISFIPIAGAIYLLVLLCQDGDKGENAYGPSPKT